MACDLQTDFCDPCLGKGGSMACDLQTTRLLRPGRPPIFGGGGSLGKGICDACPRFLDHPQIQGLVQHHARRMEDWSVGMLPRINIRDTGPGLSIPLYRAKRFATHKEQMGLGLRRLVHFSTFAPQNDSNACHVSRNIDSALITANNKRQKTAAYDEDELEAEQAIATDESEAELALRSSASLTTATDESALEQAVGVSWIIVDKVCKVLMEESTLAKMCSKDRMFYSSASNVVVCQGG